MDKHPLIARIVRSPRSLLRFIRRYPKRSLGIFLSLFHVAGALTSVQVVMEHRSPQGAAAWAIALNTIPYVAVPAYWFFGHTDFDGYTTARRSTVEQSRQFYGEWLESLPEAEETADFIDDRFEVLQKLAGMPYTRGNAVELLIDGEAMFEAVLDVIAEAEDYLLLQYYIVKDDAMGKAIQRQLMAKAREGVRVYFLYDEIGSVMLGADYIEELEAAGVQMRPFGSNIEGPADFRVNFRNHRKMVVADGRSAVTGGSNIGDEYLGRDPDFGAWRDTNVKLLGPVVRGLQVAFSEDWAWASGDKLSGLAWDPPPGPAGEVDALCLPTGPADHFDTCALFYHALIGAAEERLWIATPYFVPDDQIVSALQLAALRGVDVKILIPEEPDSKLVYFSSFTYLDDLEKAGVKVYRYQEGFLHQKVVLVDDGFATVGTANFDNRSFRLNFEVTIAVHHAGFAGEIGRMLERDFARSRPALASDFADRKFLFRLSARVARLLSPIQ